MISNARVTLLLFALLGSAQAQAATRTVTDIGDAGDGICDATCTLRDAVNAAQADDRILFALALPAAAADRLSIDEVFARVGELHPELQLFENRGEVLAAERERQEAE